MKIEEILAKVAKGETLTESEKQFAAEYKPGAGDAGGGDDNSARIPKARLDAEIAKRKEAEAKNAELATKVDDLTSKVEELETAGMSEAEKAKKEAEKTSAKQAAELARLTKERDEAVKKAAEMEFAGKVQALAAKHNFTDPDYLAFKLRAGEVKLDDEGAVTTFMKGLEKSAPGMFRSTAKPGAGTTANGTQTAQPSAAKKRLEELNSKKELTNREVAEVIELQGKVKAEAAQNGGAGENNSNGTGTGSAGAGAGKQE